MTSHRTARLAVLVGLALGTAAPLASAQDAGTAEMRQLIEAQSAQIRALQQQLAAMDARLAGMEAAGAATATAPAAPASPEQAQVAAAIASTRDDAALLRIQQASAGGGGGDDTSWRKGGPEFRSADGRFRLHPRGRLLMDFSSTDGSAYDARNINGTEMRQARLGIEGEMGALGYKLDADFADNAVTVKEAYLSWDTDAHGMPLEFYAGNRLKDRSIEGATALPRVPFMERNAVASVGSPDSGYFGLGGQAKLIGPSWHVSVGVTGDDLGSEGDATDTLVYSTRAHWNPVKTGSGFVHLGGWYFDEELGADIDRINKVPRIGLHFNDETRVSASSISDTTRDHAWGAELGGVWRNLWGFAEATERTIDSSTEDSVVQKAQSVYGGWLITGEKPGFSTRSGVWGTTRVLDPVTEGGWGAFELVSRYDHYDFSDAERGGTGNSVTVGMNWYLNNWSRLMLNLVHWKTDNQVGAYQGEDSGNSLGLRAQVVF
ncbi:OprO/OprP family phosphate-selective porin [Coralloluteibacterium stylophorae]|uniref:Porin n=1 Tax=Coralloluteibacterium stylophorae TaxID=1776034 RepID=A0A8J7VQD3_9GAMM|nr:porin [Coralloluteibacterium stylophorae]MBS7458095.1 porin [Coralloluteibacterium stylophorae]